VEDHVYDISVLGQNQRTALNATTAIANAGDADAKTLVNGRKSSLHLRRTRLA